MLIRKPPFITWPRFLVGLFVPYSAAMVALDVQRRLDRGGEEARRLERENALAGGGRAYEYESAVTFLVERGLPEDQVRGGSMPEPSLKACSTVLRAELDSAKPVAVLHVGNFVGVSLSWFAELVRGWQAGSRVIGLDPNVVHRGIERPQEQVIAVLREFGLERLVLLITGYTLTKNAGDAEEGDVRRGFDRDQSPENALVHLAAVAPGQVDVAVMDGNHEASYLRRELESVRRLLRPGGLMILDDVFDWDSLAPIARELEAAPDATLLARDYRVGIWRISGTELPGTED